MNQRLIYFLRIRAICETCNETLKIETDVCPVIFIVQIVNRKVSETGRFSTEPQYNRISYGICKHISANIKYDILTNL